MAVDSGDIKATLVLNIKKFLKSIKQANSSVDEMANDIGDTLDDIVEDSEEAFEGMRGTAAIFGSGLASVGGAIGASLLAMTDNFKDTKKSLNSFGAQTGITGKELDGFKDKIESTYLKGYGEDIQEVSDTYSQFQRELKLSANETESLTEKAFQLRDVYGYEIEDSLRAVSSSMNEFGISGEEAYDLISVTAQKAGDRADDLLDTVDEYSKDFAKAGYSAEDMFNLLIGGADAGIRNFDVIGDTVKEFGNVLLQSGTEGIDILTQLTGSEEKAKSMMENLGNGTLSTKDAMQQVVDGLGTMDDKVQQNQIGASLFGSLWEEAGLKGLQAMTGAGDAVGEYNGTLETANETLKGQGKTMEQVKREFEQVTNQIGEQLAPILSSTLDLASKFILKLLEFSKANPMLVKIIAFGGLLISILGAIAGAIIAVGAFIGPIIASLEFLGSVIAGIGAIAGTVGAFLISLPGLIIIAIIALVALIIWKWDEIKAFTITAWTAIVDFILNVPTLIQNAWIAFIAYMLVLWQNLKTNTINTWNSFLEFIKSIPSKLYTFFTSTLPQFIGYVIGAFVKLVVTVNNKIYTFFTETIPNTFTRFWNFVVNLFTQKIPQIQTKVALMVVNLYNKFLQMKARLIQKAEEILNGVIKWFRQLPSKVLSFGEKLFKSTKELGKKMIDGLKNFKKDLPKLIKDTIKNALDGIGNLGSTAYNALKSIGSSMWSGFKKGLGISSPSYIERAMFDISDEGVNMKKNLFNTFRSIKKLPQINSLAELTKRQQQYGTGNNEDNRTTQNFNAPLVQISGGNETAGQRTAYSLYDMITFKKRAMGVGD